MVAKVLRFLCLNIFKLLDWTYTSKGHCWRSLHAMFRWLASGQLCSTKVILPVFQLSINGVEILRCISLFAQFTWINISIAHILRIPNLTHVLLYYAKALILRSIVLVVLWSQHLLMVRVELLLMLWLQWRLPFHYSIRVHLKL